MQSSLVYYLFCHIQWPYAVKSVASQWVLNSCLCSPWTRHSVQQLVIEKVFFLFCKMEHDHTVGAENLNFHPYFHTAFHHEDTTHKVFMGGVNLFWCGHHTYLSSWEALMMHVLLCHVRIDTGIYSFVHVLFHIFQLPVVTEAKKRRAPKGTMLQLTLACHLLKWLLNNITAVLWFISGILFFTKS